MVKNSKRKIKTQKNLAGLLHLYLQTFLNGLSKHQAVKPTGTIRIMTKGSRIIASKNHPS